MSGPNGDPHVPAGGGDEDGDGFGEEVPKALMAHENPVERLNAHTLLRFGNNGAATSTFGLTPVPATAPPQPGFVKHIPAQELYTEYAAINSMLDQINSCLDHLEEKNDHLHACLKELLESNRQTRLEFQQQSKQQHMEPDVQGSQPPV